MPLHKESPDRVCAPKRTRSGALIGGRGQPSGRPGVDAEAPSTPGSWIDLELLDGGTPSAWPDDAHGVPAWRLKAEARAAELGITLPAYRTRVEFDKAVAVARKMPPTVAAGMFAEHVRGDRDVVYSHEQLADAYRAFCNETGVECPENFFRAALKCVAGVSRSTRVTRHPRRVREAVWIIAAANVTKVSVENSTVSIAA